MGGTVHPRHDRDAYLVLFHVDYYTKVPEEAKAAEARLIQSLAVQQADVDMVRKASSALQLIHLLGRAAPRSTVIDMVVINDHYECEAYTFFSRRQPCPRPFLVNTSPQSS